ncbi:MAG: carbamoyl phosphate synthase small subunit [Clostridiales bacterium]|nr:carbamoyl phosphate synthase small subunit [Clostridiales bacterium]
MKKAYLVLENGDIFEGSFFGSESEVTGEVVFTTSMTGYLETLTDKSYCGQIIVQAFPLIGNYGVIPSDFEGAGVSASGYVVSTACASPSNFRSQGVLGDFLKKSNVPAVCGIDTRRLIKTIRSHGTMNGRISFTAEIPEDLSGYRVNKAVEKVSCRSVRLVNPLGKHRIALFDFGYKENILRELVARDCAVTLFPCFSSAEEILSTRPDGIMLSNGPGDPADNTGSIEAIAKLCASGIPIFGICLGHQLLALANGFKTEKLKFGHRGANHPARSASGGRVFMTSQNHGYAVVSASIDPSAAAESFVNMNDGTNEGIDYKKINAFSVQFHPEGSGGPLDTGFLFDRFISGTEA